MAADDADVSEDLVYGGRVRVRQPRRGYRVNADTILLAASLPAADAADGARVVELGCGVGAGLLVMARNLDASVRLVGVERDAAFAALARANVAGAGAANRVEIIEADALDPGLDLGRFDHVLFNPPYDDPGEGRPPAEARRAARLAERPLEDWVKLWCNRMSAGAALTLIHRPQRLPEILAALQGRLGAVAVYPIRPFPDAEASRVIVRARKGSRAPLRLLAGLTLHPPDQGAKHTPEAEAILRGEAWIGLG